MENRRQANALQLILALRLARLHDRSLGEAGN